MHEKNISVNEMDKTVDFKSLYKRFPELEKQPIVRRILLENVVRHSNLSGECEEQVAALASGKQIEIAFRPSRILMQDYAGMPALIDLAALRTEVAAAGHNPSDINPQVPVDLVVDHSVMATTTRTPGALEANLKEEYAANAERYSFLKWAAQAFTGLRIVPPGQGIVHQVNTELFATVVTKTILDGVAWQHPDTLIGTDSHTTMVNGMGVLGWGVGGIEAEAVMLGESVSMVAPPVVSVWLEGEKSPGTLGTDVVLSMANFFRQEGVVGEIIEFCGPGVGALSATDRFTIANMAPEFGATAAFFPVDEKTLEYLHITGRSAAHIEMVESYLRKNKLFYSPSFLPVSDHALKFDLSNVNKVLAGPKRPDELRQLSEVPLALKSMIEPNQDASGEELLGNGDIVIAAITSCTNTSNPEAMIAAGLLARNARDRGMTVNPLIKTSLAPGSRVVTSYLKRLGLLSDLEALGFDVVAYGCTTCVGNSGELSREVLDALDNKDTVVASVLSGNRNFEGRIHPRVKANFLASPPLVVAYALAGTMNIDLEQEPVAMDGAGKPVFLSDLWPSTDAVSAAMIEGLNVDLFTDCYRDVTEGGREWDELAAPEGPTFLWPDKSTYLRQPPFFTQKSLFVKGEPLLKDARPLLLLGDFITTDHISPVGRIAEESPASTYLQSKGVAIKDFNAYGARRGEHEVMARGTFANVRLKNLLVERLGGWTRLLPDSVEMSIHEAAEEYQAREEQIVVFAGKMYGAGSARDWAAKGTRILGVKAILAESFERIHRANLVRMGVLPLKFEDNVTIDSLNLGDQTQVTIEQTVDELQPFAELSAIITDKFGIVKKIKTTALIETIDEKKYLCAGGILPFVTESILR